MWRVKQGQKIRGSVEVQTSILPVTADVLYTVVFQIDSSKFVPFTQNRQLPQTFDFRIRTEIIAGIVRTNPGFKPSEGVFISNIPDITRGHWQDIAQLSEIKQRVSAASDAQQGMPTADGIRTATEIQRLTQLGSQRLGVLSRVMSSTTIRPLIHMMVANIQDATQLSGSIKAPQNSTPGILTNLVNDGFIDFNISDLQGNIEYLPVDGTLPIEPTRNAETWLNMLQILQTSGLNMEYNAGKIVDEAIRAMGVNDIDQYKISKEQADQGPTPSQQLSIMEKMRGASVVPQQDIQSQLQQGNIVPLRQ